MGSLDRESSGEFLKVVEMEVDLGHLGYSPDRYVRVMTGGGMRRQGWLEHHQSTAPSSGRRRQSSVLCHANCQRARGLCM